MTKWLFDVNVGGYQCPHWHRTSLAAEQCLRVSVRAARKGSRFYGDNALAQLDLTDGVAVACAIRMEDAAFAGDK